MMVEISYLQMENIRQFMVDMSQAFQYSYEQWNVSNDDARPDDGTPILPESDIEETLRRTDARACQAMAGGELVGGAIFSVNEDTARGELLLLYVKVGCQNLGVGKALWGWIEAEHTKVCVWETVTPYHDKRNIHFYINKCGFSAVEFYNPMHRSPYYTWEGSGDDYDFRFEKRIGHGNVHTDAT